MEEVNHQYKDSLFCKLFKKPDVLRELYGALKGIVISPETVVDINSLDNVLLQGFVNDISFVIGGRLVVLLEHQSTINPNMCLRFLMYITQIYEQMHEHKKLFSRKFMCIPRPEFFVLYNGIAPFPDKQTLRLSDAFLNAEVPWIEKQEPALELIAHILNINEGRNAEIASRCKILSDYSAFVALERSFTQQSGDRLKAMKNAVQYCLDHGILREYMEQHAEEVLNMRITDWNLEDALAVEREEGMEDGFKRGREEGLSEGLQRGRNDEKRETARKLKAIGLSPEQIAEVTGLPQDELE